MDKNTILGILLLLALLIGYSMYMGTKNQGEENIRENFEQRADSTIAEESLSNTETAQISDSLSINTGDSVRDSILTLEKFGPSFAQFSKGKEDTITIENDLVIAKLSNKGATLIGWELKEYKDWEKNPAELIKFGDNQLYQEFLSLEVGKRIDSRDLYFDFENSKKTYSITGEDEIEIKAFIKWEENKYIERTYRFFGDKYHIETDVKLVNLDNIIKSEYNFTWEGGLAYQEENSVDESNEAEALMVMNEEVLTLDADDPDENFKETLSGKLDYVGVKTKYFTSVMTTNEFDGTVDISGVREERNYGEEQYEYYDMSIRVPYNGGEQARSFLVYVGPIESETLEKYGFGRMVNYGWWIFRYIGHTFVQFFHLINYFVQNWGITIILFSVILKFLLYPLTRPQMKSMQKMKVLQPEIQKMKDKYKDDMARQQQETMKLYSEYGVNPLGGCLPLLLQMPILYTLWSVFRTNIDLRQTVFIPGWIDDLSVPDTVIPLPFSLLGIEYLSGLALAMGVTMFLQQKLTITDPRQKSLMYIMPLVFIFMFSNFPAGLNLYYFIFNLVAITQQLYWNKIAKNTITLESLKASKAKKGPKKEGWLQRKMKEAQAIQEARQKGQYGNVGNLSKHQHTPKRRDTKPKKKKK